MTGGALAANIACTGTLYFKSGFEGASYNLTLTPQGASDKAYVWDLKDVASGVPAKPTWDDRANSAKLSCSCLLSGGASAAAKCTADYALMIMRMWAEPGSRGNRGGASLNLTCTAAADAKSCAGALSAMPTGWGSRVSAVALLYNNSDFALPKSRRDDDMGNGPSPASKPAETPKTPSPASKPAGATPVPSPKTPSPSPSPSKKGGKKGGKKRHSPSPSPSPRKP
ncbi:hypothetical protein HYH02_009917 [Chlamydomonas schloesseri]|uniref:Uncharacterized protein n=1 Tax=Chlamydomonas schloesseri TaxID=2026947 RepID=A0A835T9J6_9CHLO|nr:hypothetical protein HYH02_009917 [Chlamydomonas schloesseri]|eukprot:KAG2441324.1 hypothetical protein HYH02_009917 [Chlamydomonas schloesseri]